MEADRGEDLVFTWGLGFRVQFWFRGLDVGVGVYGLLMIEGSGLIVQEVGSLAWLGLDVYSHNLGVICLMVAVCDIFELQNSLRLYDKH